MLRMVLYYQGGDHVLQEKFGEFLIEQRKKMIAQWFVAAVPACVGRNRTPYLL